MTVKTNDKKGISGFSKLSKDEKLRWMAESHFNNADEVVQEMESFNHPNGDLQKTLNGFSENTISNFPMPYGLAPNFLIDGKMYTVPMVIEESSVVAAASHAAKFWSKRGGFKTEILGTVKVGQVHFTWDGDYEKLVRNFAEVKALLLEETQHITHNMRKRGGGVLDIELLNLNHLEPDYYQLKVSFETCDSMGANFINSVLEEFGKTFKRKLKQDFGAEPLIIMAILSNYTPNCVVRASVECPVSQLGKFPGEMPSEVFAQKFYKAVRIATIDPYRATTHNKGIFNGIDAVVIATANDFRAVEAGGHTYASKDGQYRSLSHCSIKDGIFKFWLDIPLALGTVGGLTKLHPLAKRSLELLGNPSAKELMSVVASVGLAQNFGALRSLVTVGIQEGHMKMHLQNILRHLNANETECEKTQAHFKDKVVSFSAVRDFVNTLR